MRRLVTGSILVLAAVVLAAGPALAKQVGANLDPTPAGLSPGDPWTPDLFIVTEAHGLQTAGGPPTLTNPQRVGRDD